MLKIVLVGERLKYRSFNGANKALPVLASSLCSAGFAEPVQMDLERPDVDIDDVCREASDADLVIFAGVMTPQWPELDAHLRVLGSHLKSCGNGAPIVVGGYATKGVQDIARHTPEVAAFFNGEGERGVVEIAHAVARGNFASSMSRIKGLCYLTIDGVFHRSIAPRVDSLDGIDQGFGFIHVPSIHDMDIFRLDGGRQMKTAQIYTQRGCPWGCGYCNKSTEGREVARLSEEALRQQLKRLRIDGFEAVYLDVDTFTVNQHAADNEARILCEEGFAWGSNTRIDRISKDSITYFREHGCVYMFFGVEHTDPGVLLAIDKFNGPLSAQLRRISKYPEMVRRVFQAMHSSGLPSSYFLILGLPKAILNDDQSTIVGYRATTFEEDVAAIRFGLEACEPDYLNFNMLRFMPGSAAADVPSHPAYACVRPSGENPITAGYFLPRVAAIMNYAVPENHGVYRLCESVGPNQPTTTAMDPERVYNSVVTAMDVINMRIDRGRKPTALFIDGQLLEAGMVRRDSEGRYAAAPLDDFAVM